MELIPEQPEQSIELSPGSGLAPRVDAHRRVEEPPPVRLLAIADVHLLAANGMEAALDRFYVGLLEFWRRPESHTPVYDAEKFSILFEFHESPVRRDDMRTLGILVRSLAVAEQRLIDAQLTYTRERGINTGAQSIVLQDPAGNWIELSESDLIL